MQIDEKRRINVVLPVGLTNVKTAKSNDVNVYVKCE